MKQHRNVRRGYGWKPDLPDMRDLLFGDLRPMLDVNMLPPSVDLDAIGRPIDDQGSLGSCVAQACTRMEEMVVMKDKGQAADFSRLFLYWNARVLEDSQFEDSGCMIRDAMKSLAKQGCCFEINWPYDISKFAVEPDFGCYVQAEQFQVLTYHRLRNVRLTELLNCLAEGYPFVGGLAIYESFESATVARTGIVPTPQKGEQMLGGHALCFVGYDRARQAFRVANSWGTGWGDKGYCFIPFDYVSSWLLASDFWTVRTIENV